MLPEVLRVSVAAETSFSHEVRRVGLGSFTLFAALVRIWSGSSSEDARASESGVDRRSPGFDFSNSSDAEGCCEPNAPNAGIALRGVKPDLCDAPLIAEPSLRGDGASEATVFMPRAEVTIPRHSMVLVLDSEGGCKMVL